MSTLEQIKQKTVGQEMADKLEFFCVPEEHADAILMKASSDNETYAKIAGQPVINYSQEIVALQWAYIRVVALAYLNEHCPRAWFKAIFDDAHPVHQKAAKQLKRLNYNVHLTQWQLNLTAAEHTPFGWVLCKFYYSSKVGQDLLELAGKRDKKGSTGLTSSGFPNNGGRHTLEVCGSLTDLWVWYNLFYDYFKDVVKPGGNPAIEFDIIKQEFEEALKK